VHLWLGLDMTTRVRLRGIDAPELKASCPQDGGHRNGWCAPH